MKKLLSFILVLAFALGLLAGCGSSSNTDKPAESGSASASASDSAVTISTKDINFVENGEAVYRIIRPEDGEWNENTLGSAMFTKMKQTLGVSVKNMSDGSSDEGAYEILIGNTNRAESKSALNYLASQTGGRYNDFIICTIGNKIVINAYNAERLKDACDYFSANYIKAEGVKGGINYIAKAEGDFSDITVNGKHIKEYTIIRPRLNSSYLTTVEVNETIDYILAKTGYKPDFLYDTYTEAGECEIIVGDSNRDGVSKISNYDEYEIKIIGSKVYLNGGSPHATAMAVSEFYKLLNSKKDITDVDSVNGSYETAMAGYDRATTYYPTYYDTFEGDQLDTSKWRIMGGTEFGREGQNGKWSGMSNDPNDVFVSDGKLHIIGRVTEDSYLGGTITNDKTMEYHYGYLEYSAICPNGSSFWSLLWCVGSSSGDNTNFYPEIDINECYGNAKITQVAFHAWPKSAGSAAGKTHYTTNAGKEGTYYCPDNKTWSDDFHTFGLIWDQNHMAVTADGDIFYSYDTTTNEDDIDAFVLPYMYMKFSFSVGRLNNGEKAELLTEENLTVTNKFIVDWMYLYQLDDGWQKLITK